MGELEGDSMTRPIDRTPWEPCRYVTPFGTIDKCRAPQAYRHALLAVEVTRAIARMMSDSVHVPPPPRLGDEETEDE